MGLISSLNNAMANLVGRPWPSDIQSRPLGKAEVQSPGKSGIDTAKSNAQAVLEARQVRIDQTMSVSLLDYHLRQISEVSGAEAQAHGFARLGALFAQGSERGVDTSYAALQGAVTGEGDVAGAAQDMATALNWLAVNLEDIAQQAGQQLAPAAAKANSLLMQLAAVNLRLDDGNMRPDLLAQRDQLVLSLAEQVDVKVRYGDDGQVSLTTRSGVTLLGAKASRFEVEQGKLTLQVAGASLDFSAAQEAGAGTIGGVLNLQNKTLVVARTQIDAIAAGLYQLFAESRQEGDGLVLEDRLFALGDAANIAVNAGFVADPADLAAAMEKGVEIAGVSADLGDIVGQVVAVQGQIASQGLAAVDERRGMLEAVGYRLTAPVLGVRDEIGRLAAIESMFRSSSSLVGTLKDTLDAL